MNAALGFLLTAASSLFVSLAFPRTGLAPLAWFGIAPLLFVLRRGSYRSAAGWGFLFGTLFCLGTFLWTARVDIVRIPNVVLCIFAFSLYTLTFGLLYRLLCRFSRPLLVLGAPSLWVALEFVRANLFFLSWPWNLLGHTQYLSLNVIQIADTTGVYGVSFLLVMVNQVLSGIPDLMGRSGEMTHSCADDLDHRRLMLREVAVIISVFVVVLAYGWTRQAQRQVEGSIRVALVQANLVSRDTMSHDERMKHLLRYGELSVQAAREAPAIILWPASSLPAQMSSRIVRVVLPRLAQHIGTYLLVGGAGHEKDRPKKEGDLPYSNSEFLISPDGKVEGQYNKIRLLPFNEYVPLSGLVTWPAWVTTVKADFIRGQEYTLFRVGEVLFGAPICWENLFPDLFRRFVKEGANFMVSVTNEGFLGDSAAPYQALAMNVFRAVENRRAVVRVATTGISAFIDPNGEITAMVRDRDGRELFVSGILVKEIPLSGKKTFYTLHGDVFALLITAVSSFLILTSLAGLRRRGRQGGGA